MCIIPDSYGVVFSRKKIDWFFLNLVCIQPNNVDTTFWQLDIRITKRNDQSDNQFIALASNSTDIVLIIYIIGGSVDPSQENIDHSRLVVSCLNQIRFDFQGAEKRSLFPDEWIL